MIFRISAIRIWIVLYICGSLGFQLTNKFMTAFDCPSHWMARTRLQKDYALAQGGITSGLQI